MTTRRDTLDRLAKLANQLNAETNGLTDKIKQLEKHLGRMRLGVTVWLEELIEDTAAGRGYVLGYTKLKDRWRIATKRVTQRQEGVEDAGDPRPLVKAPRIVRLRGIGQLDTLVSRLTDRVESFLAEVTGVKETDDTEAAKTESKEANAKAKAEEDKAKARAKKEEAKAKAKAEEAKAKAEEAKAKAEEAKAKAKAKAEEARAKAEEAEAKAKAKAERAQAKAEEAEAKAKAKADKAKAKQAEEDEAPADETEPAAPATADEAATS